MRVIRLVFCYCSGNARKINSRSVVAGCIISLFSQKRKQNYGTREINYGEYTCVILFCCFTLGTVG